MDDATKLSECTGYQLSIVYHQVKKMQDIVSAMAPSILPSQKSRFLDSRQLTNMEYFICTVVDYNGLISDFISLDRFMTELSRELEISIENQILCLHVISKKMSPECLNRFVMKGGLLILKLWLKKAGKYNRFVERIIQICLSIVILPDHIDVLKDSKIANYMRKNMQHGIEYQNAINKWTSQTTLNDDVATGTGETSTCSIISPVISTHVLSVEREEDSSALCDPILPVFVPVTADSTLPTSTSSTLSTLSGSGSGSAPKLTTPQILPKVVTAGVAIIPNLSTTSISSPTSPSLARSVSDTFVGSRTNITSGISSVKTNQTNDQKADDISSNVPLLLPPKKMFTEFVNLTGSLSMVRSIFASVFTFP